MENKKTKVVIINDGAIDLKAVSKSFEDQGFEVSVVEAGKEAETELRGFEGLLVKRVSRKSRNSFGNRTIKAGEIEIDPVRCEVRKAGRVLPLTIREFNLLVYLIRGKGKVFSREDLLSDVWGYEYLGDIRTVDVTIRRLREKLEDDPSEPSYIKTKRSVGYYFDAER